MRYIINCIQNYAASFLIACCIVMMGVACSSKVGSSATDAGSGGVCGDGICDYNEDEFSCSQDCTSGPECSYECGADGEVHYCDEAGNDASYACPEPLGSSCVSGQDFLGCSCGNITALGSCYSDESLNVDLVRCESGFVQFFYCSDGSFCDDSDGQAQCYCDDASDGICPDAACVDDPDCAQCTPNCAGSVCGDNGCGGSCGSCQPSQSCQSGSCQSSCTPSCSGSECGSDGCGGSCGSCTDGSCVSGVCTEAASGYSISYSVNGSENLMVSGSGAAEIICDYDEDANDLRILSFAGSHQLTINIHKDPIGFCLFGRSSFEDFNFYPASQAHHYKIDSYGQTGSVTLSCDITGNHLSATFSAEQLYPILGPIDGGSSDWPTTFVNVTNGVVECDF